MQLLNRTELRSSVRFFLFLESQYSEKPFLHFYLCLLAFHFRFGTFLFNPIQASKALHLYFLKHFLSFPQTFSFISTSIFRHFP